MDELAQERESGSEVVSEALVTKRGRRLRESAGVPGPGGLARGEEGRPCPRPGLAASGLLRGAPRLNLGLGGSYKAVEWRHRRCRGAVP